MSSNSSSPAAFTDFADGWLVDEAPVASARERAREFGITSVSPATARFLTFLTSSLQAQAVVEVGTGTGVSGAALVAGMTPGGMLTSIDIEAEYQRYARETLQALGHETSRARLIAGRALDVLPECPMARMTSSSWTPIAVSTRQFSLKPSGSCESEASLPLSASAKMTWLPIHHDAMLKLQR